MREWVTTRHWSQIANKHARIIWAVLAKGEAFDPKHGEIQPA
ncbi:hypothetical protein [Nitrosomonas sp. Nm33]|nr:hypothetical protein [Nitrosomonas sp. Nm33]